MTAPDDLAALLEQIRERAERADQVFKFGGSFAEAAARSQMDVPALLKVAEAVLKLADGTRTVGEVYEVETDTFRPVTWNLDPAKVREIITITLAGEAGDE